MCRLTRRRPRCMVVSWHCCAALLPTPPHPPGCHMLHAPCMCLSLAMHRLQAPTSPSPLPTPPSLPPMVSNGFTETSVSTTSFVLITDSAAECLACARLPQTQAMAVQNFCLLEIDVGVRVSGQQNKDGRQKTIFLAGVRPLNDGRQNRYMGVIFTNGISHRCLTEARGDCCNGLITQTGMVP